jgi:hypothetical protein
VPDGLTLGVDQFVDAENLCVTRVAITHISYKPLHIHEAFSGHYTHSNTSLEENVAKIVFALSKGTFLPQTCFSLMNIYGITRGDAPFFTSGLLKMNCTAIINMFVYCDSV